MESLIAAARARALEAGDPLGALNRVALRDDAPAFALRGIAIVQHRRFSERDPMSATSAFRVESSCFARSYKRRSFYEHSP